MLSSSVWRGRSVWWFSGGLLVGGATTAFVGVTVGALLLRAVGDESAQFGPLQFGFEMGTGLRTYMTSGLPHALIVPVVLLASWQEGLVAGVAFGAGRAWMALNRHAYPDKEDWDFALRDQDRSLRVSLTVVSAVALTLVVHTLLGRPA